MAAVSKGRELAATLGKRFACRILAAEPAPLPSLAVAAVRGVHSSTYDKNYDEHVRPVVVPDHVIQTSSDKYWGPHPKTGVFGPAEQHAGEFEAPAAQASSPANGGGCSVLDQTAWFRSSGDVDKPSERDSSSLQ